MRKSTGLAGFCLVLAALAGCDLFKEPTPKAAKNSGPALAGGAPTSTAPATAPAATPPTTPPTLTPPAANGQNGAPAATAPALVWKRQTVGGVSFEAPFDVTAPKDAPPAGPGGLTIEAYSGVTHPENPGAGVLFTIGKMSNASQLVPNMERALRQTMRNSAQQAGDANPSIMVTPVQLGQASGFVGACTFQDPSGRFHGIDVINVHSGGTVWIITANSGSKEMHEVAKRIMASVALQP